MLQPHIDCTHYCYSLLGFRLAPPVVGRVVDLNAIKTVTSQRLLDTYFMKGMLLLL